ncbi:DUF6461 domain-containing protein [Nocardia jiangxiensis]|uniref:DUF6461 domain-containing protein n=1 Tax=Nocardia jiangxiensis TaxID=282685 RepID=A0ABW6RT52_9NOCA|nr:DUF6461 domain-containing protein [Nocardia jiangxiensis]
MTTPGFPPNTLDDEGFPLWISGLEDDDPNHCVHVVKGLEPAEALEVLGAKPRLFQACELPDHKPERMSAPRAALGDAMRDSSTALLAGRIGEWTFVYDDFGATEDVAALSADGRIAAMSYFSINADASLMYCADGEEILWVNVDDLVLETDLADMPADLRAAFEAAGTVAFDYLDPGEADFAVCMRAVSALAGIYTLDDLRRIPLLVTPFG